MTSASPTVGPGKHHPFYRAAHGAERLAFRVPERSKRTTQRTVTAYWVVRLLRSGLKPGCSVRGSVNGWCFPGPIAAYPGMSNLDLKREL